MPLAVSLVLLVLASIAFADHTITFHNQCPFALTPMWKANADGASYHSLPAVSPNATASTSVPEIWQSGRFFAQDPDSTCLLPDGARCTLAEVNFGPGSPRFWQSNLSLVSGYNVPMALAWVGGTEASCSVGFTCTSAGCPASQAYLASGACSGCINQCNADGVGMRITFCPAGSVIPAFARAPSAPATTKSPAPAPATSKPAPASATATQPAQNVGAAPKPTSAAAAPATSALTTSVSAASATPSGTRRCPSKRRARALRVHRALRAGAAAHS